jgi:hypothetical protein
LLALFARGLRKPVEDPRFQLPRLYQAKFRLVLKVGCNGWLEHRT